MVLPAGACTAGKILAAVGPFVRAAVLPKYGESVGKKNVCPGETNCDRFQTAKGRSRAAKERNACHGCELFDTKRERYRKSQQGLSDLVTAVEYVQRRRDSGYPLAHHQISDLMLETLLMMDECRDREDLRLRISTRSVLMAGFGLKVE